MSFILDAAHHVFLLLIKHMQNMLWPCVTRMFYYIYTLAKYHVTLASLCSNTKTFLMLKLLQLESESLNLKVKLSILK